MIVNELYNGQGLGNQLWNYVVARILADKNKCDFAILGKEKFKGKDFIEIDFGKNLSGGKSPEGGPATILPDGISNYYKEKHEILAKDGSDISRTDPKLLNLGPNTKFDGNCQSTEYLEDYEEKIFDWIKVTKTKLNFVITENTCVMHIRGGDFKKTSTLLPKSYYEDAMTNIRKINPNAVFVCVTDDPNFVKSILPEVKIVGSATIKISDANKANHHLGGPIEIDFNILMNSPYLIIPHSSFSWWAAFLNKNKKLVIAPKYWARFNVSDGFWSTFDILTKGFYYQDKTGKLFDYAECKKEKDAFKANNLSLFTLAKKDDLPKKIKKIFSKIIRKISYLARSQKMKILSKKDSLNYARNLAKKEELEKYRKNIKIYDIFTYNGEVDILKLRLNILYDHVDQFVIVEAPTTFSGLSKPLYFEQQKERFEKFKDKIKYFVIDDYPNDPEILEMIKNSPNVPKDGPEHWRREFFQKESVKKALTDLQDEDFCFVGDVDEIWNPDTLIDYTFDGILKLEQEMYVYYLNNHTNEPWAGTIATKYKNIKRNSLNSLRNKSLTKYVYIKNAGWHFTNMGGLEEVRRKLRDSYTEESYNTKDIQENLDQRFGKEDYIGRRYAYSIDESKLPKYVLENKEKYKNLLK